MVDVDALNWYKGIARINAARVTMYEMGLYEDRATFVDAQKTLECVKKKARDGGFYDDLMTSVKEGIEGATEHGKEKSFRFLMIGCVK